MNGHAQSAHLRSDNSGVDPDGVIDISVVIPVYNSETTLPGLFDRLSSTLAQSGRTFEIIFVDDGSRDSSWKVLQDLFAAHPDEIVAVQLTRNFGQHNALMCGFRNASGKFIVTMDDDLQNPPEEVLKLLTEIEASESDVVYGVYSQKEHAKWRNLGSSMLLAFYKLIFKSDVAPTAFRIIRRSVVQGILRYTLNFTYIDGLLAWHTQRVTTVEVVHAQRETGRSGYTMAKLVLLATNLFTNFSLLPLQLVSALGFVLAIGGFAVATYFLIQFLLSRIAVPGFASLIIAIMVLGGAQMMALGIVGEYLGRLHLNVNQKPQYHVRRVLESDRNRGK